MITEKAFKDINGSLIKKFQFQTVTICPMCKHAINPHLLHGVFFNKGSNDINLSIHYFCMACSTPFIAHYNDLREHLPFGGYISSKDPVTAPKYFKSQEFDHHILAISPNFVEIYNQALQAEDTNLHQIAGVGYRKALEFLIKDFLIHQHPTKEEEIKNKLLGRCVKMLGNSQLETVAEKATWLGNDQTHYVQKFTDKDISDLKRLVRLTVHWISMLLETEEAEQIESRK